MSNDDTTDDPAEADQHTDRLYAPMTGDTDADDTEYVEPSVTWQEFDDAGGQP